LRRAWPKSRWTTAEPPDRIGRGEDRDRGDGRAEHVHRQITDGVLIRAEPARGRVREHGELEQLDRDADPQPSGDRDRRQGDSAADVSTEERCGEHRSGGDTDHVRELVVVIEARVQMEAVPGQVQQQRHRQERVRRHRIDRPAARQPPRRDQEHRDRIHQHPAGHGLTAELMHCRNRECRHRREHDQRLRGDQGAESAVGDCGARGPDVTLARDL